MLSVESNVVYFSSPGQRQCERLPSLDVRRKIFTYICKSPKPPCQTNIDCYWF